MRRFRIVIGSLVAVAMLSFGVAACTPEQQKEVGVGLGDLIGLIFLDLFFTFNPLPPCPPAPATCPPFE